MLVTVRLFPRTLSGPEGGQNLLLPNDPSPVVDLRVIRRHETVESIDVEPQVSEEPFAFSPEHSLDRRQKPAPNDSDG